MDEAQAKSVSQTFQAVHTSVSARLARGAAERKRVFDTIKSGGKVDSYRLDWLKSATANLANHLAEIAHDFNVAHTGFDQCSVQDLTDVLEMCLERYKKG